MTSLPTAETTQVFAENLDRLIAAASIAHDDLPAFRGLQFDLGLAWVHFPVGTGGVGLDPEYQLQVDERLAEHGISDSYMDNPLGIGMVAPTRWCVSVVS